MQKNTKPTFILSFLLSLTFQNNAAQGTSCLESSTSLLLASSIVISTYVGYKLIKPCQRLWISRRLAQEISFELRKRLPDCLAGMAIEYAREETFADVSRWTNGEVPASGLLRLEDPRPPIKWTIRIEIKPTDTFSSLVSTINERVPAHNAIPQYQLRKIDVPYRNNDSPVTCIEDMGNYSSLNTGFYLKPQRASAA